MSAPGGADRPRAEGDAAAGPHGPRRRLHRWYLWAAAVLVLAAAGVTTAIVIRPASGLGTGTWWTPGHPQLQVSVVAGCPGSVGSYADVVNTLRRAPSGPGRPERRADLPVRPGPRQWTAQQRRPGALDQPRPLAGAAARRRDPPDRPRATDGDDQLPSRVVRCRDGHRDSRTRGAPTSVSGTRQAAATRWTTAGSVASRTATPASTRGSRTRSTGCRRRPGRTSTGEDGWQRGWMAGGGRRLADPSGGTDPRSSRRPTRFQTAQEI